MVLVPEGNGIAARRAQAALMRGTADAWRGDACVDVTVRCGMRRSGGMVRVDVSTAERVERGVPVRAALAVAQHLRRGCEPLERDHQHE